MRVISSLILSIVTIFERLDFPLVDEHETTHAF